MDVSKKRFFVVTEIKGFDFKPCIGGYSHKRIISGTRISLYKIGFSTILSMRLIGDVDDK
jgi:hypothetical protein